MTNELHPNVTLRDIFGDRWTSVRTIEYEGRIMHMAHDICEILAVRNVTIGIRGVEGAYRVDLENRDKVYVPEWTPRRRVHVLSIEGVFQLIINNKTDRCKEIKRFIACRHLPAVRNLRLREIDRTTAVRRGRLNG
jgi:prophage antirepressor-like protein